MNQKHTSVIDTWPWGELIGTKLVTKFLRKNSRNSASNLLEQTELPLSLRSVILLACSTDIASLWLRQSYDEDLRNDLIPEIFDKLLDAGCKEDLVVAFLLCLFADYSYADHPPSNETFSSDSLGKLAYFVTLYSLSGLLCQPSLRLAATFLDFASNAGYEKALHLRRILDQAEHGSLEARQEIIEYASMGWATTLDDEWPSIGVEEGSWVTDTEYQFLWKIGRRDRHVDEFGIPFQWALEHLIPVRTMLIVAIALFQYGNADGGEQGVRFLTKAGLRGADVAWEIIHEWTGRFDDNNQWILTAVIDACREESPFITNNKPPA